MAKRNQAPAPEAEPAKSSIQEVEITPELVELVAAKLAEQGALPQAGRTTDDIKEIAKEVALAVSNEARADAGLLRRSSRMPVEIKYELTPENYNVMREAEKLAEKRGHTLGAWENMRPDITRTPILPVRNAWQSRCIGCGALATARWMPPPKQDNRPDTGDDMYPVLGGDALAKNHVAVQQREAASQQGFSHIASRSEMNATSPEPPEA